MDKVEGGLNVEPRQHRGWHWQGTVRTAMVREEQERKEEDRKEKGDNQRILEKTIKYIVLD